MTNVQRKERTWRDGAREGQRFVALLAVSGTACHWEKPCDRLASLELVSIPRTGGR